MNYAKLMLFGEYTVLHGGMSLAIPFKSFGGTLTSEKALGKRRELATWSNKQLLKLYNYLSNNGNQTASHLDMERFAKDISLGLWFDSNIPGHSGFGSSGALVASVFRRFALDGNWGELTALRNELATMERSFHGKSSGIDPLVSFLNCPVLMGTDNIGTCALHKQLSPDIKLFIISMERDADTKSLIWEFNAQLKDKGFKKDYIKEMLPLTNAIINNITGYRDERWFDQLKDLSILQSRYYNKIIPANLLKLMHSDLYHLKLLGSGGGFMLGFTKNWKDTHYELSAMGLKVKRIEYSELITG